MTPVASVGMALLPGLVVGWTPGGVSIISRSFLVGLGAMAVAALVATIVLGRRRRWFRWLGSSITVVLLLAGVATAVNTHYAYLPNVGSLFGWRAADQTSWSVTRHQPIRVRFILRRVSNLPAHGAVVKVAIPGVRSGFHARPAEVYLPPAWFMSPRPQLPVIVMLHGSPGTPEDWTRSAAADQVSDRWAAHHEGVAPILVMPDINGSFNGDSECTDGTAGNVETYLTVDVRDWVLLHLHAASGREQWAIGGLSEGGTCAVDLALRHSSLWATFLDWGGDDHISHHGGAPSLFTGSLTHRRALVASYDPIRLLRHFHDPARLQGWFEVGASDGGTTQAVQRLAAIAQRQGMIVHLALRVGGTTPFGYGTTASSTPCRGPRRASAPDGGSCPVASTAEPT